MPRYPGKEQGWMAESLLWFLVFLEVQRAAELGWGCCPAVPQRPGHGPGTPRRVGRAELREGSRILSFGFRGTNEGPTSLG